MKELKPIIFILIVLILTVVSAYPQRKFGGTVVEVTNGKTAVIQLSTGNKVTAILQFIEIPEAEQPLHQTVKEHLQTLLLGKTVLFLPRRMAKEGSVGQIVLDGVDISQQMLRDGAAWYALPEKSAQDAAESEAYQSVEAQAKAEKRGVWGVDNLKTAWEFRAEREELRNQEERAKLRAIMPQSVSENKSAATVKPKKKATLPSMDIWSNLGDTVTARASDDGFNLRLGTVPKTDLNYISTVGSSFVATDDKSNTKIEARLFYIYSEEKQTGGYIIAFLAESGDYKFAESSSLTLIDEVENFNLGKGFRYFRKMPFTVQELLIYKIDLKTLQKLSFNLTIGVKLGKFSGMIKREFSGHLRDLLWAMNKNPKERP